MCDSGTILNYTCTLLMCWYFTVVLWEQSTLNSTPSLPASQSFMENTAYGFNVSEVDVAFKHLDLSGLSTLRVSKACKCISY